MNKSLFLIISLFWFGYSMAQETSIYGEVPATIENNDTIYFTRPGHIASKYYKTEELSAPIKNGKFHLKTSLDFPYIYAIIFKSNRGKVPPQGEFLIDRTTNLVKIDSLLGAGECSEIRGKAQQEFKNKLVPFLYQGKDDYNCYNNTTQYYRYVKSDEFDFRLEEYIKENPDSFVGLWMLIDRFSTSGYSPLYKKMAASFSDKMKQEELWKILDDDINGIQILQNKRFPEPMLKTIGLKEEKLALPTAKFTLIDFWFSHCQPCLKAFPTLKELYKKHRHAGFEIVGISVDRTQYITKWKETIKDKELDWPQYLDENGEMARSEKIRSYPTNFLLNEKGEVIQKNIPLKELENLLEQL